MLRQGQNHARERGPEMAIKPTFGDLLSKGIKSVAAQQARTVEGVEWDIAQALGYTSHHIVERWRKGHIPKKPDQVEYLIRYCVTKGHLGRDWAHALRTQAGYNRS